MQRLASFEGVFENDWLAAKFSFSSIICSEKACISPDKGNKVLVTASKGQEHSVLTEYVDRNSE